MNFPRYQRSADLANEEDSLKANLNYVQDNIANVQQSIMEVEEGKEASNETQSLSTVIENLRSVDEAKFLLSKLTEIAIANTCDTALTQGRLSEQEAMLKEVQQESGIQQQLLQHFLAQNPSVQIMDLFDTLNINSGGNLTGSDRFGGSNKSLNSNSTYDIPVNELNSLDEPVQMRRSPSPSPREYAASDG